MEKRISFCFLFGSLIIYPNCIEAQQGFGQIAVNVGVGYSPEFDGDISFFNTTWYPIAAYDNATDNYYPPAYNAKPITPNIGGAIDFGLLKWFTFGLAISYQSEMVNWTPSTINYYGNLDFPYNDKVIRTNIACRLLFHLNKNRQYFEHYIGFRIGVSFWHDDVYPHSYIDPTSILYLPPPVYFIGRANLIVPSFQILYGMRFYFTNHLENFGVNFELGIGSPYLMEGGLTYRINHRKTSEKSKQNLKPADSQK